MFDWIVTTQRQGSGSHHHVSEEEARRILRFAPSAGVLIVDGPRPATEIERLTPQEREAYWRSRHKVTT